MRTILVGLILIDALDKKILDLAIFSSFYAEVLSGLSIDSQIKGTIRGLTIAKVVPCYLVFFFLTTTSFFDRKMRAEIKKLHNIFEKYQNASG